jgi:hypothetical protein
MKNLKKLSRNELKTVEGGINLTCADLSNNVDDRRPNAGLDTYHVVTYIYIRREDTIVRCAVKSY